MLSSEFFVNDYNIASFKAMVPFGDDFSIYVNPRVVPFYKNGYERLSTRIFKNFVKHCDMFVDIGANYGYYSLLAGTSNKTIKIIAIEPIEENFQVLNKNLRYNNINEDRCHCIQSAITSASGKIKFYKSAAADNCSAIRHPNSKTIAELDVDAMTLDDVLKNEKYQKLFIKTDTDGNELSVLQGAAGIIDMCENVTILLEINPKMLKIAGVEPAEIINFLKAHDFALYAIDDDEYRFYALENNTDLDMMYTRKNTSYFNVLCIKRKAALSVVFFSHWAAVGGAERSLLDLVRGLSDQGILCTAVLPFDGLLTQPLKELGCAIYIVPPKIGIPHAWWWCKSFDSESKNLVTASLEMARNQIVPELQRIAPDVIFSQTIVSPWGAVCAGMMGLPHVLSAREYGELDHHLNFLFGFKESIAALYDSSESVVCISKDVSNVLFGEDKARKTAVIYSNVQVDAAAEPQDNTWHVDEKSAVTVGVFGSICIGKGQEDLVRAVIMLCKRGMNVKCVMAGHTVEDAYAKKSGTTHC